MGWGFVYCGDDDCVGVVLVEYCGECVGLVLFVEIGGFVVRWDCCEVGVFGEVGVEKC